MPLSLEGGYSAWDYWNLPEGARRTRWGKLYDMAPPSKRHRAIVTNLSRVLGNFIEANGGPCEVYVAPFAVNLSADESTFIEPDVTVACDPSKFDNRGCKSAPDLVVEVVSPSSRRMDYATKTAPYMDMGVREHWICDPDKSMTTVYLFEEEGFAPVIYPFGVPVPVSIYAGRLQVAMGSLAGQRRTYPASAQSGWRL